MEAFASTRCTTLLGGRTMELKQEDLWNQCPECKGTGKPQDKPQPGGWRLVSDYCENCRGTGQELTPSGKVLQEFIRLFGR